MNLPVDPKTLAAVLQVGGQYAIPAAALLKALYASVRGRTPEGIMQIAAGAAVAGASAAINGQQPNVQAIISDVLSNTVFTAGLLTFIVLYLLRVTGLSWIVDVVVGGVLGAIIWLFTNYVLGTAWPLWLLLLIIPACAIGMVLLRFALRQIMRVVKIATLLLIFGVLLAIGAGGFMVLQTMLSGGFKL